MTGVQTCALPIFTGEVEGDGQGVGALRVGGQVPGAVGEAGPEAYPDGVGERAVALGVRGPSQRRRPP